jgi:Protein of unknown function (DUF1616)
VAFRSEPVGKVPDTEESASGLGLRTEIASSRSPIISRRNIVLQVALVALCAGVVLGPAPTALRVVAGIPLVLLLPGFALTSAVFARRRLGRLDVLFLSLAFSLSIVVLGTLVLNALPWGLTRTTWTALVVGVAIVASVWALVRIPAGAGGEATRIRLTMRQAALVATALLITAGVIIFARTPLPARGVEGYTALWIVPDPSRSRSILVGVRSSELHATSYKLKVRTDDREELDRQLTLAPGNRWTVRLRVPGSSRRVEGRLFRSDAPNQVYRRVRLILRPPPPA